MIKSAVFYTRISWLYQGLEKELSRESEWRGQKPYGKTKSGNSDDIAKPMLLNPKKKVNDRIQTQK